jgi:hypothetical protein
MDFEDYKNTVEYPAMSSFTTVNLYKRGEVLLKNATIAYVDASNLFPQDPISTLAALEKVAMKFGIIVESFNDELAYKAAKGNYRAETSRLHDKFKADLEEEFGVVGNPKADLLFSIAWEHGHSAGYSEVYNYYSEFVVLIDRGQK